MAEITEAFKWLADRGFGQAPKTVQIEGSVTTGFKMVFRRWAPGTDPASLPLAEMPKSIVGVSLRAIGRRAPGMRCAPTSPLAFYFVVLVADGAERAHTTIDVAWVRHEPGQLERTLLAAGT